MNSRTEMMQMEVTLA